MRKRIIGARHDNLPDDQVWLNLEDIVEIELTSEDSRYPIESALLAGQGPGWRASEPGTQTLRLIFAEPRQLGRIRLVFTEPEVDRTQEYVLRWSKDAGQSFTEIVRQQWNFSPEGAHTETEDYHVELPAVTVLELEITPDIKGQKVLATLKRLQLA